MTMDTTKIFKFGNSNAVVIPAKMMQTLGWNRFDRIAIRYAEGKLIMERIPLENLAKVRAGVVNGE